MDLKREFDQRIAAIHRLDKLTSSNESGENYMDIRRSELQAMADVFVGKDLDDIKFRQIDRLQVELHKAEDKLYQIYDAGKLTPEQYVESVNAAVSENLKKCEEILGEEDFIKLFGAPRSVAVGLMEKETFLRVHHSRRGEKAETYIDSSDDQNLIAGIIDYPGRAGTIRAHLARPDFNRRAGAVILVHGESGFDSHIREISRRFAKDGFIALAPDLLSRLADRERYGSAEDIDKAIKDLSEEAVAEDLNSAVTFLQKLDFCNGRIGLVGYSWGGKQSLNYVTKYENIDAVVLYYGANPDRVDAMQNISCPIMGHYAADDHESIIAPNWLPAAMAKFGKTFDMKIYEKARHGFDDSTNPERYHPEAAEDSWNRTIRFLKKNLHG